MISELERKYKNSLQSVDENINLDLKTKLQILLNSEPQVNPNKIQLKIWKMLGPLQVDDFVNNCSTNIDFDDEKQEINKLASNKSLIHGQVDKIT